MVQYMVSETQQHVCVTAAPANGHAEQGSLYEAESWAAIGAVLFGPDPSKALTPHPSAQNGKQQVKVRCYHNWLHLGFSGWATKLAIVCNP